LRIRRFLITIPFPLIRDGEAHACRFQFRQALEEYRRHLSENPPTAAWMDGEAENFPRTRPSAVRQMRRPICIFVGAHG
jgi:hypothetical protein